MTKKQFVDEVIAQARAESGFVESSEYTIEAFRRILMERLGRRVPVVR